jgi:peptidoglycan-associated lipoprotein
MKLLKYVFIFLFTTSILQFATAQSKKKTDNTTEETTDAPDTEESLAKDTKKANEYFEAKEYNNALELYKRAFSKAKGRKEKADITFNQAECYRFMNDCKNAANFYKRAVKMKYDPIAQLRYADMLRCQGEYEEAISEYQIYKQEKPGDKRGEEGIESCKMAIEWMKTPSRYMVNNMKDMNSKNSDFQAAYAGKRAEDYDVLLISSTREESIGKREDGWTGQRYSDIYITEAERKKGRGRGKAAATPANEEVKWSAVVPLSEMINTKEHEGAICFDSKMKTMYFTRCINEKNMKMGCMIFETRKQGQDWAQPELVIAAPDSLTSVGHPSLSPDDQFLYFASDMPGTMGGKDIWVTTYDKRKKQWTDPKNLGLSVNTGGDEVFPFAHDDGYLYFSSNGLVGMGGLDIYRIKVGEDGLPVGKAENLKFPINTNTDDFAIVWEKGDSKKGFMASDRKGGKGSDDIYSVYLVPLKYTMDGIVISSKDGRPIPQATVRLDGTDGTSIVVNTDKDGHFFFTKDQLKEDTQYKINVEKKKFLTNTADFTTMGVDISSFEFVPSENIYLHGMRSQVKLDPIEVPIVLPNVFFDLAKWDLRPEAQQALDSVVTILNNNPTIVIELRSHTDYRDTDEKNDKLSFNRADTCVKYIASKGIAADRMVAVGMGEKDPFVIPEGYAGYGASEFAVGTRLTEAFIKTQPANKQEIANQINRRTDFKVLRDDYVPNAPAPKPGGTTESPDKPKEEVKSAEGQFHTCGAKDNFGGIAKQYGITVVDLKKLNGGLRGVRVFEGLMLKVTKDGDYTEWDASHYQVQMGDNLSKIATATGVSEKVLRDLNDGLKDKDLLPGMWLTTK